MNQEIKQKWIDALPSYKQGKHNLKTEFGEFCCLGVLCDLYIRETGLLFWEIGNDNHTCYIKGQKYYLPNPVLEWAGLADHNPVVDVNGTPMRISDANDSGINFQEISKIIKEQL